MIGWISKKHREKKRREDHERRLRKSLAEKLAKYEASASNSTDDVTELFINGEKRRVAKQQITITDVLTEPLARPSH